MSFQVMEISIMRSVGGTIKEVYKNLVLLRFRTQSSLVEPYRTDYSSSLPLQTKMKLALIFLSALVVITHQQFQSQPGGGRPWWSPYSYPQLLPSVVTNHQEIYYNNFQDDIPLSSFRRFRPTSPVSYFTQNADLHPSFTPDEYQRDFNEAEEFPDTQSRKKISNNIRPRPLSNKLPHQQKQRFFYNYYTNVNSILTKTATFTLTSTLSLTTVQSCIAAAKFKDDAAKATACRRKRGIFEIEPEETQFEIDPTETLQVMQTALPSLDGIRESRQLLADSSFDHISGSLSTEKLLMRAKRFFKYSVTSVTVTTYSLLSATVTKTVAIGDDAAVLCLPSGWTVC